MVRRSLLLIPLLVGLAVLVGARFPRYAVVLAAAGAVVGLVAERATAQVAQRRIAAVADRVLRFAQGDTATPLDLEGSRQWRRLSDALTAVGGALEARFDELAGERERAERLLETLPTAVLLFAVDSDSDVGAATLAYANPAARTLFQLAEVPAGLPLTPLRTLGVQALADAVAEARETGRSVELEVERADRSLVARTSVTAPGEVALVVSDLTEARLVEAVRRDFVINASHELKTPVAGIQALAESLDLAFERDPVRARRMVGRLQVEAARLATLVRELLDLARLEDTSSDRGRRRVDLAGLVRGQIERVEPLAAARGIRLRATLADDASVVAVPEDMRLIAANLIENAVQYNRDGGRVDVALRRDRGQVILRVDDTGIGIGEQEQDRVFERFYRVDKARSRAVGGTGLGLAIVRHAVQRHGGDITLRSVLGEGSSFRVVLPVEGAVDPRR